MRTSFFDMRFSLVAGAVCIGLAAGCAKTEPAVESAPAIVSEPQAAAPAELPPPAAPSAEQPATTPESSPAAPAPAPAEPPPQAAASADEPALSSMAVATASSKMGVPVDLRYRFDGEALPGQPVTLHLAAVPRMAGSNLRVSIKQVEGLRTTSGDITAQKATADTAYRRQLTVTRLEGAPSEVRVLVTMDIHQGQAFSYYSLPFQGGVVSKQKPVRQE